MTTFIKTKLKNQINNIDKYRVVANIKEYHIFSKVILLKCQHFKQSIKWIYWFSDFDYRNASPFFFFFTAKGITPESLKLIGQHVLRTYLS